MKRLWLIILMQSCCYCAKAQTNLDLSLDAPPKPIRIVQSVLEMDDYTYVCDTVLNFSEVRLYNIDNMPWEQDATLLSGDPIPSKYIVDPNGMYTVKPIYSTHLQKKSIVDNAFSKEQAELLNGEDLFIFLRVSSTTGKVTDVYFKFMTWEKYTEIPLDVFREMELKMKNELHFEITELGKSLTYSALFWSQCPEGRAEALPEEETDEDDSETINTNLGTININKGTPTTNRGTMTPIGGFGKGATTTP